MSLTNLPLADLNAFKDAYFSSVVVTTALTSNQLTHVHRILTPGGSFNLRVRSFRDSLLFETSH
jgi:hypothetical protein